jgi:hypothetical protein
MLGNYFIEKISETISAGFFGEKPVIFFQHGKDRFSKNFECTQARWGAGGAGGFRSEKISYSHCEIIS